ncbi:MAG: YciI family protein [Nodosilinea sp.]
MQYAILVYETEHDFAHRDHHMPAYRAYSQALDEAGVMVGGAALHPSHTATTLRLQNNQRQVQDGPYADTKEQLGGFFLIDVPDLDTALNWAAH